MNDFCKENTFEKAGKWVSDDDQYLYGPVYIFAR